jgi:hypothetical protein
MPCCSDIGIRVGRIAQVHTIAFRFDVQNNLGLGGVCCIGSPIDDRQYGLVQSIGTPWSSADIPSSLGPAGPLFDISYVEFQPQANVESGQVQLIHYGAATWQGNGTSLLNFTLLRQLDRPNRYAILEIRDSHKNYGAWQTADATARSSAVSSHCSNRRWITGSLRCVAKRSSQISVVRPDK